MFFHDHRKHGLRHNPFKALNQPVARLGYMNYGSVETVFEMLRPDRGRLRRRRPDRGHADSGPGFGASGASRRGDGCTGSFLIPASRRT